MAKFQVFSVEAIAKFVIRRVLLAGNAVEGGHWPQKAAKMSVTKSHLNTHHERYASPSRITTSERGAMALT
jgi:hypothetical protein